MELYKETKKNILQSEKDFKNGNFYTLEEVERELHTSNTKKR